MREGRASATATWAALFRAAAARGLGGAPPHDDTLAESMLPWRWCAVLATPPLRTVVAAIAERRFPGVIAWHGLRTRVLDAWVREELARLPRPARLAIVAAGLDTRALRIGSGLDGVEVVELDHEDTQRLKRARLARLPGAARALPAFRTIDLARDDVTALLGVDRPSCVVLEGVTMYLVPARVDAILAALSRLPAGSSVVFDVLRADVLADPDAFEGGRAQIEAVGARGEPYVCGFDRAALRTLLAARGLTVVDDVGVDEIDLPGARRACAFFRLVRARVTG